MSEAWLVNRQLPLHSHVHEHLFGCLTGKTVCPVGQNIPVKYVFLKKGMSCDPCH